jgi:hypothetical protein
MKDVEVQLHKGILSDMDLKRLQLEVKEGVRRKGASRRSLQKGGPAVSITELRERKQFRDESERTAQLRIAKKRLQ